MKNILLLSILCLCSCQDRLSERHTSAPDIAVTGQAISSAQKSNADAQTQVNNSDGKANVISIWLKNHPQ